MSNVRCKYCGRFVTNVNNRDRCTECEKQFNMVVAAMTRRHGGKILKLVAKT